MGQSGQYYLHFIWERRGNSHFVKDSSPETSFLDTLTITLFERTCWASREVAVSLLQSRTTASWSPMLRLWIIAFPGSAFRTFAACGAALAPRWPFRPDNPSPVIFSRITQNLRAYSWIAPSFLLNSPFFFVPFNFIKLKNILIQILQI